ncbi:DUF983 domain-containing protein [Fulvivirga sp. 29W222]|uniref:DUF983 domain-containing protein n=2 Tax=Fulvivirga marina TaxID=2494733 RepID=A0A937KFG9_9BACT|nr:DUF983 domain-containing protein [Fulvivirga marina]
MHDKCPCCEQRYQLEPAFYDGAMYVSYALQVAIFTSVSVALIVLAPQAPTSWYVIGIISAVLLLLPLVLRLSRSIWIHFFVKYDKSYSGCSKDHDGLELNCKM